jgi:hypothetical protein
LSGFNSLSLKNETLAEKCSIVMFQNKQPSNQATKQLSNRATKQPSNQATMQISLIL